MTELIPLALLVDQIDAILPQTQCTKCGYQGCRPYAEAIAAGDAINKCPPGGQPGIEQLASLLKRPALPLDTSHGEHSEILRVAFIREAECIGCTKCIQACPVDAIIGAAKLMHTVISDICTGCDLCVAPCPVDCIDMVPAAVQQPDAAAVQRKADLSRQRFQRRNARLAKLAAEKQARRETRQAFQEQHDEQSGSSQNAAVLAALAAVRERATQQSTAEQRSKLEKNLAAARERFERADAKVREAKKHSPEQLAALQARREDMRFKLTETEKKLAALAAGDTTSPATDAVERLLAARGRKSDEQRLSEALVTIANKLSHLRATLATAPASEHAALAAEINRLQDKLTQLEAESRPPS